MRSKLGFCYLAVLAAMAILIGAPAAHAAVTNSSVTVYVNISSVGSILIIPTSVSWMGLNPGSNGIVNNMTIKNTGSLNVTNVYLNASTINDEPTNPLQSTNPASYAAAGLIMVKNATEAGYTHAGRLEWNISSVLLGEILNLNVNTTISSHGWYRNSTGNEYLWKLENGTEGYCNTTDTKFTIKLVPENYTTMNRDLSANTADCTTFVAGTNENWGVFTCADGPLMGQCIATPYTCDKIYIYKYNYAADYPACGDRAYLRGNALTPGSEAAFTLMASIPKGMPAGNTTTGILNVIATY